LAGHNDGIYRLLVSKALVLRYAITGDGPCRYQIDLVVVSPVILVLAIGGFSPQSDRARGFYLLLFVVASFILMANVRYGMNLRYTNMWDFPLRYLAVYCLWQVIPRQSTQALWLSICIAALCLIDLRQYDVFFV
jgi:hypothetical protein